MPVTRRTLILARGMRVRLDGEVDAVTLAQLRAWNRTWRGLENDWREAIAEVIASAQAAAGTPDDLDWPSRNRVLRAQRVLEALEKTRQEVEKLADASGAQIIGRLSPLVADATTAHAQMVASQMPTAAGTQADLAVRFNRVDAGQLAAIVTRSTQQVTALHYYLAPAATEAMKEAIVRGVALGNNPRAAARRMLAKTRGEFNGGLVRANVIARTEMLDAHREAAQRANLANADVLRSWIWTATLDARTCRSCWAQHGSEHALTEFGPIDHQQGRCVGVPKTKTWAELGFTGLDEAPDATVDARAKFATLPEAEQLQIMGPQVLPMLRAGQVGWDDLSTRRTTAGWRDSLIPTPVYVLKDRVPA